MVEFKIPEELRRAHSKLSVLDFRTANFALLRDLKSAMLKSSEGKRGPRKLVNIQESPLPNPGGRHPNKRKSSQQRKSQVKMLGQCG